MTAAVRLRRTGLVALALAVVTLVAAPAAAREGSAAAPDGSAAAFEVRMSPLPDGVRKAWIEPDGDGGHSYLLELENGRQERVTPAELANRLARDHRHRSIVYRFLNITSPVGFAWVALGLLGQVLCTGRMVLQWLTSEKARRSVVPVGFWWMSLAGASMLMLYFIWRRDIVGVLGQSAGWMIYARNLWLIYRPPAQHVEG